MIFNPPIFRPTLFNPLMFPGQLTRGGGNFSPLSLSPVAWWDASDSNNLLKSIGPDVVAGVGETVYRWRDKITGATLDQATSAARWTRATSGIIQPPLTSTAGMTCSIPVNHRSMSIVFVFARRRHFNHQPAALWLNTSNASGAIMERAGGTIYGGTTAGAINNYDADGSLLAFCNGPSSSVIYNHYKAVSLAARTAGTSTIQRLFDYAAGGNPSKLPVQHVLIFDRQLTANEITSLRAWAGMAVQETVLFTLGDSIAAGATASDQSLTWINQLADSKGWTVQNGAISGTVASSIVSSAAATLNNAYTAGKTNKCILHVGTNDLAANVSAATLLSNIASIYSARKSFASDWQFILATVPPRNNSFSGGQTAGGYATARATVNAALQAASPGTYFDVLLDFAADPDIGPDAAAVDTDWFDADKIHPNQGGHDRMASISIAELP